jgi:hypothetical protein
MGRDKERGFSIATSSTCRHELLRLPRQPRVDLGAREEPQGQRRAIASDPPVGSPKPAEQAHSAAMIIGIIGRRFQLAAAASRLSTDTLVVLVGCLVHWTGPRCHAGISPRQFTDLDHARGCGDRNLEMIRLHNVCDVARPMGDDVVAGSTPQAVIQQSRTA